MARRKPADPKQEALSEHGTLNPGAGRIHDPLFLEHEFFDTRDLMQVKYELLRRVREEGHSVTEASTAFGVSRPTFYEALRAFEREGLAGLIPKKRGPRQAHKLGPEVMEFVQQVVAEEGPIRTKELVGRVEDRFGIVVHQRSLERAFARLKKKRH